MARPRHEGAVEAVIGHQRTLKRPTDTFTLELGLSSGTSQDPTADVRANLRKCVDYLVHPQTSFYPCHVADL